MEQLAEDPWPPVLDKLASNIMTPPSILAKLAINPDVCEQGSGRQALLENWATPGDAIGPLLTLVRENPFVPSEHMAMSEETALFFFDAAFCGAAANPNTLPEDLHALVGISEGRSQEHLAENRNTSATSLAALAENPSAGVRSRVAMSHTVPAALLGLMSSDPSFYVQSSVAQNRCAPLDAVLSLTCHPLDYVAASAAGNPRLPNEVLRSLLDHHAPSVRAAASCNPSFPTDEFLSRALHGERSTRERANGDLRMPPDELRKRSALRDPNVLSLIAGNPSTPRDVVVALTRHARWSVAAAAIRNKSLPTPELWKILRSKSQEALWSEVHREIARRLWAERSEAGTHANSSGLG